MPVDEGRASLELADAHPRYTSAHRIEPGWPIRADHCFQRVFLDNAVGGCWYNAIPRRPAYRQADIATLERAIALGKATVVAENGCDSRSVVIIHVGDHAVIVVDCIWIVEIALEMLLDRFQDDVELFVTCFDFHPRAVFVLDAQKEIVVDSFGNGEA
jgi:hypothetical protein